MTTTYSSGKLQLTFNSDNVSVVNGSGNLGVTGTYYISIQGRNLIGLNLNSALVPVTLTTTSTLTITLPALATGETWSDIVISASTTNDVSTLTQLMVVNNADFASPVILTSVELFKLTTLERTVANSAALPATPIQGLIRYVTNLNYYYEYDEYSVATVDNLTVLTATVDNLTVLTATTGRWIRVGTISTYITDTTATDGCDQDVRTPDLIVNAPTYTCDGSKGNGVIFWLRNEFATTIPSGTRISCTVRLFEEDKSQLFDSLLILELLGYVDLTTGVLDASVSSGEVVYQPRTQWLTLPEDLAIGFAAVVRVSPKFTITDLDNNIPYLANLTTYITFAPTSGIYTPGVFGNLIYNEYDNWRIYPDTGLSVIKGKGSGIVNKQELNAISAETITGLTANTTNQYIFLTSNGSSFASTTSSFTSAVKRCVVSTINGIGTPVSYGSVSLDNTKKLSVTINYPTNIRSDYPDTLVAGSSNGEFNATSVVIYIKNSSNAYFITEVDITPSASNDVAVLNYSDFASSILAAPSSNYGLYAPLNVVPTTSTVTSTFPTDSYEVFVAFKYTNVVTVIDHSVSELYEITSNLSELFSTSATVWYSGNGIPSNSLGEDGAYYLNYDNSDVHIKVNDTWVLDGNISVSTPSFGTIVVSGQDNIIAENGNDSLTLVAGTGITLTTDATTDSITITGTSVSNTFSTIGVTGQDNIVADGGTDTLNIAAGSGITLTTDSVTDTLTITGTAVSNTFNTIAVSGQSDVVADNASDTLTLVAGSGMTITTNATTDTITLESSGTSTTVNVGTVTPLNPDQSPTVTNTGTTSAAVLAFGLPSAPTATIGTVSTLSAGSSATVTNTGTDGNILLNFGIPTGTTGSVTATTDLTLTEVSVAPSTAVNELKVFNKNNVLFVRGESDATDVEVALKKTRRDVIITSSSLANNAHEQTTFVARPGLIVYQIATDKPARIRLYQNTTKQASDVGRALSSDLQTNLNFDAGDAGVLVDLETSTGKLTRMLSPITIVATVPSSTNIPITVTNLSGSTDIIQVTLTIMEIE